MGVITESTLTPLQPPCKGNFGAIATTPLRRGWATDLHTPPGRRMSIEIITNLYYYPSGE